jgi:hypothetical protein
MEYHYLKQNYSQNKDEYDKMELYARRIQECQHDLGLPISSFPNIGISATSFLRELAQEEDDNSNGTQVEQEQVSDEQYSDDYEYEQDRLTDSYTEYLRDDFNAGDRFTS